MRKQAGPLLKKIIDKSGDDYALNVVFPILKKRDEYAKLAVKEIQSKSVEFPKQAQYNKEIAKIHKKHGIAWRGWMCMRHPEIARELGYMGEPPI